MPVTHKFYIALLSIEWEEAHVERTHKLHHVSRFTSYNASRRYDARLCLRRVWIGYSAGVK